MPSCEKCWRDANRDEFEVNAVDEYQRLLKLRKDDPCPPEQQAGPDAGWCPKCDRKTLHQHVRKFCMNCNEET